MSREHASVSVMQEMRGSDGMNESSIGFIRDDGCRASNVAFPTFNVRVAYMYARSPSLDWHSFPLSFVPLHLIVYL